MDLFTAIGKLFNIILDAARAPAEQHAQIVADGLAREAEAVQAVSDYYASSGAALADSAAKLAEMEQRAAKAAKDQAEGRLAAEVAAHAQTQQDLADLKLRHEALRAAVDLAKPAGP